MKLLRQNMTRIGDATAAARRGGMLLAFVAMGLFSAIWAAAAHAEDAPNTSATSKSSDAIDESLVKKLLGGESTAADAVTETLSDLKEATELVQKGDTGERTQKVQQRVIAGIDRLIAEARMNNNRSPNSSSRRKAERPPDPRLGPQDSQRKSGDGAADSRQAQGGQPPRESKSADDKDKHRGTTAMSRGWGFLPPRDRNEVLQGFEEEFLDKYRDQILRYYRRLSEDATNEGER